MLRMPTSTADTVAYAGWPASSGTLTVTRIGCSGRICSGALSPTATRRALRSIGTHATPTARGRDLARRAAATEHQRRDIDVVALPFVRHRDLEAAAAGLDVDVLHVEQLVAFDQQHTLARMRRREDRKST